MLLKVGSQILRTGGIGYLKIEEPSGFYPSGHFCYLSVVYPSLGSGYEFTTEICIRVCMKKVSFSKTNLFLKSKRYLFYVYPDTNLCSKFVSTFQVDTFLLQEGRKSALTGFNKYDKYD